MRVYKDLLSREIKAHSFQGIMELMQWDLIYVLKMDIEGSKSEMLLYDLDAWHNKIWVLMIELSSAIDTRGAGILFKAFPNRNFDLK